MAGHRIDRINEDVHRELCDIFRSLKDPRISDLITIVRAEVTNDLSYATVYVSDLGGIERAKESVKGLKSASGFIRRELGKRLKLRAVPELRFIADDSIERSADISKLLNELSGGTDDGDNA